MSSGSMAGWGIDPNGLAAAGAGGEHVVSAGVVARWAPGHASAVEPHQVGGASGVCGAIRPVCGPWRGGYLGAPCLSSTRRHRGLGHGAGGEGLRVATAEGLSLRACLTRLADTPLTPAERVEERGRHHGAGPSHISSGDRI